MTRFSLSGGAPIAGAGALATCTCTFSSVAFGATAAGGLALIPFNLQAGLILVAAGLVLFGLSRRSRKGALLALGAFAVLGVGYLLAPPAIMHAGALPYSAGQLTGLGLYPVGAGFLVAGFLAAFGTSQPWAAGTSMSGVALASGCSCCMVNGALNGLGAGAGLPVSGAGVFLAGMGLAAAGLARMGGLRPVMLVALGAALAWNASSVADLFLSGAARAPVSVSFRFAGWMAVMGGFALAYHFSGQRSAEGTLAHGGAGSGDTAEAAAPAAAVARSDTVT